MSFFAGNGKVHITTNQREINELNTDTIYPDTVFHSNMQSLCSLGEYKVQATKANFTVNGMSESCFEASIPQEVQNHLLDNKVVLVIMGNIQKDNTDTTPYEAMISCPINLKPGTGAGTTSSDLAYSVATSPQVTAGGLLDVSFSVNSLRNRALVVNGIDEYGTTGNPGVATTKVNGWSTDADYSAGGKVTNLLRPYSRYVQYHARGLRWRLSNYNLSTHGQGDPGVDDTPYMLSVDGILAPTFTFIVLNVRFINGAYQFINPLGNSTSSGIWLEGDNILVNGSKLNSIKILQSKNTSAKGIFTPGQSLNRIPVATSWANVSGVSTTARQYKQWSMVNFMQGAKMTNGMLAFMPSPGRKEIVRLFRDGTNYNYEIGDTQYTAHVCTAYYSWQWYNIWGYPIAGYYNNHLPTYKRRRDTLLFKPTGYTGDVLGYMPQKEPFALLDTKSFSSLYITKEGISGNYNGSILPIWNVNSPSTHMIVGSKNISFGATSVYRSDMLSNNLVYIDIPGATTYIGFNKTEESILLGVKASNNGMGTNFTIPPGTSAISYLNNMAITFDVKNMSGMYTGDGMIHGLYKLEDGHEVVLGQMYLQGSVKKRESKGNESGEIFALVLQTIGIFIMYTIRREGNSLKQYTRVMINADNYKAGFNGGDANIINWVLNTVYVPSLLAYVVRIQ